jgi:hypothetical protein
VTNLGLSLLYRLVAAVITAMGLMLLGAGLLSLQGNAAGVGQDVAAAPPTASTGVDRSLALPSFPPLSGQVTPPPSPKPDPNRVSTRIVIDALGIDLPVIKPTGDSGTYPQCNVAMYIQELHQPGSGKATYIYAHARPGMFLPIWNRAIGGKQGGPNSMLGMLVRVYTSDDFVFEYVITEVRLHQRTLDAPAKATTEQLWLQTSEGPNHTYPKTQVVAEPLLSDRADHQEAHPKAHPVVCA